jgi:hypothetical protein
MFPVTATPLMDANGNAVGFFEAITDLTSIKSQQRIILNVAS